MQVTWAMNQVKHRKESLCGETGNVADIIVLELASRTLRGKQESVSVMTTAIIHLEAMP